MKRKPLNIVCIIIVLALILAMVALYLYNVVWMKESYTKDLLRTVSVVVVLMGALIKLINNSGRKHLGVYESAYSDELGNAFCTKPSLRRKLLHACRLYNESNYVKALQQLFQLLDKAEYRTDAVPVLLFIALCYTDAGCPDDAIKAYEDLLKVDVSNARAYSNLGRLYVGLGDFEKALECYNKSIDMNRNNYYAYNNRANCYFRMDELDKAIADAKQALVYKNNGVEAASLLTIAYAMLGEEENKKHYYHIAITAGKKPQDLNEAIEYYLNVRNIPSEEDDE